MYRTHVIVLIPRPRAHTLSCSVILCCYYCPLLLLAVILMINITTGDEDGSQFNGTDGTI